MALALTAAPALAATPAVSAGYGHSCALKADGTPVCWGRNNESQGAIPGGTGTLAAIGAGGYHTCGVKSDATVACWGDNVVSQTDVPPDVDTVSQLSVGFTHTCVIKTGGAPECWGLNDDGQTNVPAGVDDVTQIAAGGFHTCAIQPDGSPVCWGWGDLGQTTVPAGVDDVTSLSAGLQHTCAIEPGGTPVCWGDNSFGQSTIPAGVDTVTAISAGGLHTCAVETDGTPVCWGQDDNGQTDIPAGLGKVSAISAGFAHTCAIKTSGGIVCWGDDSSGQRGVPTAITSAAPPAHATGQAYSHTITTSGLFTPSLSVTAGALPPGVHLTGDEISGTPTTTGVYTGTISAADGVFPAATQAFSISVDVDAPATSDDVPATVVNHDVTVTLSATDAGWGGVAHTYYTTDGSAPTTGSTVYDAADKPVLHDGERIRYFSTDAAGNAEAPHFSTVAHVDATAPATTDDVPTHAVNHAVTVTLTATDAGSGVAHTYYTTDGSAPTTASAVYDAAAKPVLHDGQRIRYFSTDALGNAETVHTSGAPVDTKAPTVAISSPTSGGTYLKGARILAAYTCSDACTGTAARGAALDTRAAGRHTFTVTAQDAAGNRASRTVAYTVIEPAPAPDTTGPAVTIPRANRTLKVRSNAVTFRLGSALEPTAGTISLKAKGVRYGSRAFTAGTGRAANVKIKLTAKAKKALKKHKKVKVVATITVRDLAGNATVKTYKVTIKRR